MRMGGMVLGKGLSTLYIASVPPVEAPMAMTISDTSFTFFSKPVGRGSGPNCFFSVPTLAIEAIFIFITTSIIKESSVPFLNTSGFLTKSTAPASNASKTLFPSELMTTTGTGYWGRSFLRKAMPSILGISMSKVTTSGLNSMIFSLAS